MTTEFLGDADKDLILIVKATTDSDAVSVIFPQGRVQTFAMEHTNKIRGVRLFGRTIVLQMDEFTRLYKLKEEEGKYTLEFVKEKNNVLAVNEKYYINKSGIYRLQDDAPVHKFSSIKIQKVRAYSNGFFIKTNTSRDKIFTVNAGGGFTENEVESNQFFHMT